MSYHNAQTPFDEVVREQGKEVRPDDDDAPLHNDPRWPRKCECGYEFSEADEWQLFSENIYVRADNQPGEYSLRHAPVGAMWDASWFPDSWKGSDGRCLVVVTPGGEWMIDSRASNCTMPNDNVHKCWVRHGEPPNITVDKNGVTCGAGAGSIQRGSYHGFLRNGMLTNA